MTTRFKDMAGKKFGRLTVIKRGPNIGPKVGWLCDCECGYKGKLVQAWHLRSGATKSCGCYNREYQAATKATHGHKRVGKETRTHRSWRAMKSRCLNPNDKAFHHYGGRGITICDRWKNSFENFLEDMGERPDEMTLDRIDNDGDYEVNNCKWSTQTEQVRNRRKQKNDG